MATASWHTSVRLLSWARQMASSQYPADELRIEVTDANTTPAEMRSAGSHDVSGRGLFLIDVLAHGWGVSDDSTTTWATFPIPAGSP
ncbi:hypothetical protein [Streptomyces cucumeris]|uniref:hypothetical protein n=1 Tax=Streptomyces cucumeris TaxID=2962890 RepID=UPI003D74C230